MQAYDQVISDLGIRASDETSASHHLAIIRSATNDGTVITSCRSEFWEALKYVTKLTEIINAPKSQPPNELRKKLNIVLSCKTNEANDVLYELQLAALFKESGFEVSLEEPDIIISGKGLKNKLAIACKNPTSKKQLHDHVSNGYFQINRVGYQGIVAIETNQLLDLPKKTFEQPPLKEAENLLTRSVGEWVDERLRNYPSENPIDGFLLTYFIDYFYGDPVELSQIRQMTFQCDENNNLFRELKILVDAVKEAIVK